MQESLTRGERRVVTMAAAGKGNKEIAEELVVTVKAVEWHLSNAYRKLGIHSRHELEGVLGERQLQG
jgi:DNA-binding NarL/FixJ family response regulator